jgi:periplasmic divalent cation tolerance protein
MTAPSHILVLTTLPDHESAREVARILVEGRLAACVSVGAPVESLYHWQGATETATEIPLTIKTRAALFGDVCAAIRARHPYELPEILAVPITDALDRYLAWIDDETRPR